MSRRPDGPRMIEVDLGPGVRGAFTTVDGGVSAGPWATLDLGLACGDDPVAVSENRRRVAAALGAPVVWSTQVHGSDVRHVAGPEDMDETTGSVGEADALVTASAGVALGVLVADCVPVLLADPVARVVASAHAGRRGVEVEVVARAVEDMLARGARADRVRAVIGPCACGRCYEVPADLRDLVAATVPATRSTTSWGTPALDLAAGVEHQLRALGVTAVTRLARCTIEDPAFFSYRRAGRDGPAVTGRFAGVVRLLPAGVGANPDPGVSVPGSRPTGG